MIPTRRLSIWPTLWFLLGYVVLLAIICRFYLFPALDAWSQAPPEGRRLLSAHSALLLSILLLILVAGIALTFRIGRFFFPGATEKRIRTKYVDVWAEAGKRTPPQ
jgi:hypothetical protein